MDNVRKPCATVPRNGVSAAFCGSTWMNCQSSVTSANLSIRVWSISNQRETPTSFPVRVRYSFISMDDIFRSLDDYSKQLFLQASPMTTHQKALELGRSQTNRPPMKGSPLSDASVFFRRLQIPISFQFPNLCDAPGQPLVGKPDRKHLEISFECPYSSW